MSDRVTQMSNHVKMTVPGLTEFLARLYRYGAGRRETFTPLTVDAGDTDCSGGEPVFRDGDYVGYVTSGSFGYTIGEGLALGCLKLEAHEPGAVIEVEINGTRRPGRIVTRIVTGPLHDPNGEKCAPKPNGVRKISSTHLNRFLVTSGALC